jgi:mannose-6-phosphate isomerase-like protein (cupin superfamily)/DNA-binding XRE family transcriptional regulator
VQDDAGDQDARLGQEIRRLRHQHGLTLVSLAARTSLSHPVLSQLERGLARPSMASLERIARALGSSQSELMARAADDGELGGDRSSGGAFTLVRAGDGTVVQAQGGTVRLLVRGQARFHPMLYTGTNPDFEEYYQHPEDEFVHVIAGAVEVDLGESGPVVLAPGDSLYYPGGTRHRWRTLGDSGYRLLAVKDLPAPGG